MTKLRDYYNNILARQSELNYRMKDFLRLPADINDIKECELGLGFPLNDELVGLYSLMNGVIMDNDSYNEYLIPIHRLLGLKDAVYYYQLRIGFSESFRNLKTNFKPEIFMFPFLIDDTGNTCWVDLNINIPENYGKIYWTNSWGEDPDYKYSSLTSMFKTISDAYDKKIISVDNDDELTCDYKKYRELAKTNEPTMSYWRRT